MIALLSSLLLIGWTLLAGSCIWRQDPSLRHTAVVALKAARGLIGFTLGEAARAAREAKEKAAKAKEAAEAEAKAKAEAEAKEKEAASPFAPTGLRVLRQIVQPALTAASQQPASRSNHPRRGHSRQPSALRSAAGAAAAGGAASSAGFQLAEPTPLQFAVELEWQPPRAVLEARARMPVTYEVRLLPEDTDSITAAADTNATTADASKASSDEPLQLNPALQQQQRSPLATPSGRSEEADIFIDDELLQPSPSPASSPAAAAPASAAQPAAASSGVEVHRFTISATDDGSASPSRADSAMELDEPSSGSGDDAGWTKEDGSAAGPARSRKRKHGASSRSRSRSRAAGRSRTASRSRNASTGSDDSGTDQAAGTGQPAASTGTFAQPRFLLLNPRASAYRVEVSSSAGSYAAAVASGRPAASACVSSPCHFTFRLPRLLYLTQCAPRSETHAHQLLTSYEHLLRELGPRDELRGVDWATLSALCKPDFSGKINKRACVIIGHLVETRSILESLCHNAELLHTLQALVDRRLAHIAAKEEEGHHHHHHRAAKRHRGAEPEQEQQATPAEQPATPATPMSDVLQTPLPQEGGATPVSASAGVAWVQGGTATPFSPSVSESATQTPSASVQQQLGGGAAASSGDTLSLNPSDFMEPVLENVLWLCLAAAELHENDASSGPDDPSSSIAVTSGELAYRAFLSAGGHLLLHSLVASQFGARWFHSDEAYQRRTLKAMATVALSSPGLLSGADAQLLRFFLLHQYTFGSPAVRAELDTIPAVRALCLNPYQSS